MMAPPSSSSSSSSASPTSSGSFPSEATSAERWCARTARKRWKTCRSLSIWTGRCTRAICRGGRCGWRSGSTRGRRPAPSPGPGRRPSRRSAKSPCVTSMPTNCAGTSPSRAGWTSRRPSTGRWCWPVGQRGRWCGGWRRNSTCSTPFWPADETTNLTGEARPKPSAPCSPMVLFTPAMPAGLAGVAGGARCSAGQLRPRSRAAGAGSLRRRGRLPPRITAASAEIP